MPRLIQALRSFTSGEVSEQLDARADVAFYASSCRTLENFVVRPQGGARNRSGTRFIAEVKDSSKRVRLIRFEFSVEQAYVIEAGHQYLRFYKDGGRIESPPGTPVEISSPWTEAQLAQLKWTQSADTMYLVHPDVQIQKLTRASHTSWTLTAVSLTASPYSAPNWPRCVKFYEERLVFAGAKDKPQRFDASKSNDMENFTAGTADGDPLAYNIASDQVNAIRWLAPMNDLLIGTAGAEFRARGDSENAPLTPTNVQVKRQTNHGCADIEPVVVGNAVLFVQRAGRRLIELSFSLELNGYDSQDMTIRAEQVTEDGTLIDRAWQQEPMGIVWFVRSDGQLVGFTYQRKQAVTGWHRHPLGCGTGAAAVESIATIPGAADDELWLLVRRTSGGTTKRYIERLDPFFAKNTDPFDAFFVDCGLSYDGRVNTTLTPGAGATVAGSTGVTMTAGAAAFVVGDVGRQIRYRARKASFKRGEDPYVNARATITGYTSSTVVTATIDAAFPAGVLPALSWGLTVTSVSGLAAQAAINATVEGIADGVPTGPLAISGGAVTLPAPAVRVALGLGYVSTLEPIKLDAGVQLGAAPGQRTRIDKAVVRFLRTLGCEYGPDVDHLDRVEFRDIAAPMDLPPPLYSGDKELRPNATFGLAGDFLIRQSLPLPCEVTGIFPRTYGSGQ